MWFLYGPPTPNPYGRDKEISELVNFMRNGQPVALVGPRRIGKTSILLASLQRSSLPHVLISVEEFLKGEKGFNFTEFLSAYVTRITATAYSLAGYKIVLEKAKSYLKQLRDLLGAIKVSFNVPEVSGTIELILDKGEKGKKLDEEFSTALDFPQILSERLGIPRIVVSLDEFQYLRLARQAVPEIFHVMRSKWQFHRNVSYVISGSAVGMLKELLSSKNEPFYQFFYIKRVEPFDEETSKNFLRDGFKAEKVSVTEEEINEIVNYVDGFPAWLNLVGLKVVVERRSVREVLSSLKEDENVRTAVEGDLRKLSPSARKVLKDLARLGGKGRPKDIEGDVWGVVRALNQLIRYGYVEREERGIYRIVDPMIVHYLS